MQRIDHEGMSAGLLRLYDLPADDVTRTETFQTWTLSQTWGESSSPSLDRASLLASIPEPETSSHRPLHLLYLLLIQVPGPWPTFDLIKHHTRILKYLPEDTDEETAWLIDATKTLVKDSYESLTQFIRPSHQPALRSTSPKNFITHNGLSRFINNFALPLDDTTARKPIVSIALPNGPLMAAVCMAVTAFYTAAPVNPAAGPEQFKADILQGGASCILTTAPEYQSLHLSDPWVGEAGIQIVLVEWTEGDDITLCNVDGKPLRPLDVRQPKPNTADDIALILFTSGTSGTKKVVPLTTHSILAGIAFVIESWGLQADDTCLNMMPLFHV